MEYTCNVAGCWVLTLISPGDCTLQRGMWLCNRDSEFTKWRHHAMRYVPLRGSWMTCHWIRPNVSHTSGFDFDHITAVDMLISLSLYQSLKFYPNRTTVGRKIMTSCRFPRWRISAILDFRGPVMDSLKSPCTFELFVICCCLLST